MGISTAAQLTIRTQRAAAHLAVACTLFGMCIANSAHSQAAATFLTGRQLAERLLHNAVEISTKDGRRGMGFVVGGDEDTVHVVTAYHVIGSATDVDDVEVSFCAATDARSGSRARAVLFASINHDVLAIVARRPRGYSWESFALAPENKISSGDRVWAVGREGDCKISGLEGAIDATRDPDGNLVLDVPRGFPGTSGSMAVTDRGLVGMSTDQIDGIVIIARSAAHIRELVASSSVVWSLEEANNYPPTSMEAAQVELTSAINRYAFRLKDVRDALLSERYRAAELTQTITDYNLSISTFESVADKYDGTLVRAGGIELLEKYAYVRDTIRKIHPTFLSMNQYMDELRRTDLVPAEIRAQASELNPLVNELDEGIRAFISDFATGVQRELQNQN